MHGLSFFARALQPAAFGGRASCSATSHPSRQSRTSFCVMTYGRLRQERQNSRFGALSQSRGSAASWPSLNPSGGEVALAMQSLAGCSWFRRGALTRAFLYLLPGRSRAWSSERRRSAGGIWLEATHAINAHRSDRSSGNVARLSRQPSHSNAVVRGDEYGR